MCIIASEVFNGGFAQFFYNSSGMLAQETLEDLRLVGATKRAKLLEQAIELFEREVGRPAKTIERWVGEMPKSKLIDDLVDAYCAISESERLWDLFTRFAVSHAEQFGAS